MKINNKSEYAERFSGVWKWNFRIIFPLPMVIPELVNRHDGGIPFSRKLDIISAYLHSVNMREVFFPKVYASSKLYGISFYLVPFFKIYFCYGTSPL